MEHNPVIDCHFHVWDLKRFPYLFPTPDNGELYRDMLMQEYADSIAEANVQYAIFMQVASEVSVQEAEWILNEAKDFSFLKGFVAGFKLEDAELASILDRFGEEKMFLGIRNILDYHEKDDWIVSDAAMRGLSLLADRNIPYHCLCNVSKHWKYIPEVIRHFPQQKFTLDHLGKPAVMDDVRPGWDRWIAEVAKYPNVYCKLSSQLFPHQGPLTAAEKRGEFSKAQKKYVERCIELFGVDRCMFGSDWPVCMSHGMTSVKDFYDAGRSLLSYLSPKERDKIFGLNCARFYNLNF